MRVFIINLARSKDRKELMQSRIDELLKKDPSLATKLSFEFFEAVDGKDEKNLQAFKEYIDDKKANFFRGGVLSSSEKACFASHLLLWKKCVELNESIIVLEDDVIFRDEFLEFIDDLISSPYDFVRLMALKKLKGILSLNKHHILTRKRASGTQGYLLRPKAALSFLKKAKFYYPLDDYMDKFFLHGVFIVLFQPFLISMHFEHSTINIGKKTIFTNIYREFLRFLYRLCGFFYFFFSYKKIKDLKKKAKNQAF